MGQRLRQRPFFLTQAVGSMATNGSVHTDTCVNVLFRKINLNGVVAVAVADPPCEWTFNKNGMLKRQNHSSDTFIFCAKCTDVNRYQKPKNLAKTLKKYVWEVHFLTLRKLKSDDI